MSPHFARQHTATVLPVPNWRQLAVCSALGLALMALAMPSSHAADTAKGHGTASAPAPGASATKKPLEATSAPQGKELAIDIKAALRDQLIDKKNLILLIKDKPAPKTMAATDKVTSGAAPKASANAAPASAPAATHTPATEPVRTRATAVHSRTSRDSIKAGAATLTGQKTPASNTQAYLGDTHRGDGHWAYEGENGPQAWGKLKPEFNLCGTGKRQSPINIDESATLQGPAEPLQFNYTASSGTVVNTGRTIQVDMSGDNTLTVRGSIYKLVEFHFHTPSGEQVNNRSFAMVAHLVHRNSEGQLAIVAVLIDPGEANALIDKVWTYMPLDTGDRVRMPGGLIDMNVLLPKDQRYYQFIGSRTTPPCTEGVLWMVFKSPAQLSPAQIRLFQQLFPRNARPVQAVNGRPVRDAQ